jgi:hypothetical protein
MSNEHQDNCPLCGRPLAEPKNKHHLIPKSKGGKNIPPVWMHKICHDKIHSVFTENELRDYYNTAERLQENEEITKFIKWLQKQPPTFYDGSVANKNKKGKWK